MPLTSILIVEDDKYISSLIQMFLKDEGYKSYVATSGKEAFALFYANSPDVVLLDLGLPDMDGMEIISTLREKTQVPILVVSAREEELDKINALDAGADDFITKPFFMGELLARIRVAERKMRSSPQSDSDDFQCEELHVSWTSGIVSLGEKEIHLTPTEFKLLKLLIENRGKVLTHNFIIHHVWGFGESNDAQSLRVFMASLRRKIELDPAKPHYIITQVGVGYRFINQG
ncbi:MAG: response regulator transcription factor [Bacilli bacterium]|jgi:two-component system KDP operon response regulator KdpE